MTKADQLQYLKLAITNSWNKKNDTQPIFTFHYRKHCKKPYVKRNVYEYEKVNQIVDYYTKKLKLPRYRAERLRHKIQKQMDFSKQEGYVTSQRAAFCFTGIEIKKLAMDQHTKEAMVAAKLELKTAQFLTLMHLLDVALATWV